MQLLPKTGVTWIRHSWNVFREGPTPWNETRACAIPYSLKNTEKTWIQVIPFLCSLKLTHIRSNFSWVQDSWIVLLPRSASTSPSANLPSDDLQPPLPGPRSLNGLIRRTLPCVLKSLNMSVLSSVIQRHLGASSSTSFVVLLAILSVSSEILDFSALPSFLQPILTSH
ncbi:hypothetical protein K438DRAFT_2009681 [Mycena galopus ATCC 62051]|nr:hypothetical protein K438DRAFT_2009681 [Mycena galopus ATCC 62051]